MAHKVKCRVCKQYFDTDATTDWVCPSTNWYYHTKCYADWVKRKGERALDTERTDDEWFELLKDYIWRDIKIPGIDWSKVTSQWKNFLKTRKFTPKGIYFAVIYFYEVQRGNPTLAKGGIGIVANIYNESAEYWSNLETKRRGTLEKVVQQITARTQRPTINVSDVNRRNTARIKYNLDDVMEDNND